MARTSNAAEAEAVINTDGFRYFGPSALLTVQTISRPDALVDAQDGPGRQLGGGAARSGVPCRPGVHFQMRIGAWYNGSQSLTRGDAGNPPMAHTQCVCVSQAAFPVRLWWGENKEWPLSGRSSTARNPGLRTFGRVRDPGFPLPKLGARPQMRGPACMTIHPRSDIVRTDRVNSQGVSHPALTRRTPETMCHPAPRAKRSAVASSTLRGHLIDRAPVRRAGHTAVTRLPRCRQTLLCARTFRHRPEEVLLTNT